MQIRRILPVCIFIVAIVITTSCGAGSRRQSYLEENPNINPKIKQLILEGRIAMGMTINQLRASWGVPRRINRTHLKSGTREQWIYGYSSRPTYVYFVRGKVVSWQN